MDAPTLPTIDPVLVGLIVSALSSLCTMPLTSALQWLGTRLPFFPALTGNATVAANVLLNSLVVGILPLLLGAYGVLDAKAFLIATGAVVLGALNDKGFYELLFKISKSGTDKSLDVGTDSLEASFAVLESSPSADEIADAVIAKLNAASQNGSGQ